MPTSCNKANCNVWHPCWADVSFECVLSGQYPEDEVLNILHAGRQLGKETPSGDVGLVHCLGRLQWRPRLLVLAGGPSSACEPSPGAKRYALWAVGSQAVLSQLSHATGDQFGTCFFTGSSDGHSSCCM